jgi:hypothetical protein
MCCSVRTGRAPSEPLWLLVTPACRKRRSLACSTGVRPKRAIRNRSIKRRHISASARALRITVIP